MRRARRSQPKQASRLSHSRCRGTSGARLHERALHSGTRGGCSMRHPMSCVGWSFADDCATHSERSTSDEWAARSDSDQTTYSLGLLYALTLTHSPSHWMRVCCAGEGGEGACVGVWAQRFGALGHRAVAGRPDPLAVCA